MSSPAILFAIFACTTLRCYGDVPLENGKSPNGAFEIRLEADKESPGFEEKYVYGNARLHFIVRSIESGKVVSRIEFRGSPDDDGQPVRKHIAVLWSPLNNAFALNTSQRRYSWTTICRLNVKVGKFLEVPFPTYKELTGQPDPDTQKLLARGHDRVENWNKDGAFVWRKMLSPMGSYPGNDSMNYRITLGLSAKGMKVISRVAIPKEQD